MLSKYFVEFDLLGVKCKWCLSVLFDFREIVNLFVESVYVLSVLVHRYLPNFFISVDGPHEKLSTSCTEWQNIMFIISF